METENQTQEQEEYIDLTEPQDTGFEPAKSEDFGVGIDLNEFEKALSFPTTEDFSNALGF